MRAKKLEQRILRFATDIGLLFWISIFLIILAVIQIIIGLFTDRGKLHDGLGLLALASGAFAVFKFYSETNQKSRIDRIQFFMQMRSHFRGYDRFNPIFRALEEDDRIKAAFAMQAIDIGHRIEFASFLEDVVLAYRTLGINKAAIYYMFGDYIITTWNDDNFWEGICEEKDEPLWMLLKYAAEEMEEFSKKFNCKPGKFVKQLRISE